MLWVWNAWALRLIVDDGFGLELLSPGKCLNFRRQLWHALMPVRKPLDHNERNLIQANQTSPLSSLNRTKGESKFVRFDTIIIN
jgi:hypothetical protein